MKELIEYLIINHFDYIYYMFGLILFGIVYVILEGVWEE